MANVIVKCRKCGKRVRMNKKNVKYVHVYCGKCFENVLGGNDMQDLLKSIQELETKRDNCTITDEEEARLKYLLWQYSNPIVDEEN